MYLFIFIIIIIIIIIFNLLHHGWKQQTVENMSINTNKEIWQSLLAVSCEIRTFSTVINDLATWRNIVGLECHYEDQNDAVSVHGSQEFY